MAPKHTLLTPLLALIAFNPLLSPAKVLTSLDQLTQKTYDFVIIGGGTAGSALANRLTENKNVCVLVVEAGDNNVGNLNIEVPFLGVALPGTSVDWNFTTVPQPGLNGRTIPYTRGFVLGGSSSVNLLTYHRGSDDVWDRWAQISGDSGWNWKSVEKYYLKSSRLVPPADGRNVAGLENPKVHGNGPVEVSVPGFPVATDDIILKSAKQLGGRFAFHEDFNDGTVLGIGYMQSTIGEGQRSSGATAYLNPVFSRSNLDVLVNTHVTKLINTAAAKKTPIMNKVELVQSRTSPRVQVSAKKEVILSAGVIGTPQLLQLSGIGNPADLATVGIPTLVNLPEVGYNLADHPLLANYFQVQSNSTFDDILRDNNLFGQTLGEWQTEKQGQFVDSPGNTLGFFRLPPGSPAFKGIQDPAAGPKSGHTELIFVDGFAQFGSVTQPTQGHFVSVLSAVVSPTSRGTVKLASQDPFTAPLINPNFFATQFDIQAMTQAIHDALTFMATPLWQSSSFKPTPFGDVANATTDAQKEQFIRNRSVNVNHPVGTARMSKSGGVVDSSLRVKGVQGLRVVDASIFPVIPESHTQGPVYIVAERAADLIKAAYNLY
ncbi:aryl-alcohol-oxidase from pleurotus Eryingii [Cristinia sonorae]|uniref:Aryl-alcohol-oxidase from pleurotus Eryingii n=1 Tax=Cristinia sonorae TaxID=1940300 RepID=A0A8K0XM42_9AGAR|nr:aryl-alcohol-oxidase from pleurotus Eryingii [Cristinia sonorae]